MKCGLAMLGILLPLCLCTHALCQTRDLVTNGGFEQGAEGWQIDGGALLADKKEARSGANCVSGEVTEPKKACLTRRTFHLEPGNIYRFSFWVKGTNRTKAVVWLNKDQTRRSIGFVKEVSRRWMKHTVPFSVSESGEWRIDLVAPSSHGAPAGRAWVDDISLIEIKLPSLVDITNDDRFNERPALAASGDGSVYCACVSFDKGKETIRTIRLANPSADKPEITPLPEVALPQCDGVWSVALASAKSGAWLAASCDVGGNWDIYLWKLGPNAPGEPVRVTMENGTNINPAIATFGGRTFVAWETNRNGPRQIFAAEIGGGEVGSARQISSEGTWNYYPCIAGDDSGRAWLVWQSFRDGNYDIYGAEFDGEKWSKERRLTNDPRIELRPAVAMGKTGAWMAWEIMTYGTYRTSSVRQQQVVLAQIGPDCLMAPKDIEKVFSNYTQHPTITCDSNGRVWVAVRQAREREGWDVMLRAFCGRDWSPERQLTATTGRTQLCPMAIAADRLLAAIQHDTVAGSYSSIEQTKDEKSNIALCNLPLAEAPPAQAADLARLSLPETDFDMVSQRKQYGEELPRRTITYSGQQLNLYWGQFHEHSEISVCNRKGDLPPEDNYFYNRDIHKMDFSALTDHGYNLSPAIWNYLSKIVRTQDDPGIFASFLGEEWTSTFEEYTPEHPCGFYGHRNLIFADSKFPRWFNARNRATPSEVWAELRKMNANFIHIPHQLADNGNVPTDWNFTDEVAQPIAEIFQSRQSYEYRGCPRQAKNVVEGDGYFIQDAWAKGVVIGVIASPDHGGGMGKAAIYAPSLTREAILDACRARRTYGTSAAKIFIDARVNGHLMGEKIKTDGGPIKIHVEVIGAGEIDRVDVCRSNKFIYAKSPESTECKFDFEDPDPLPGNSYYYVRVIQKDEELAWTSPVWVTR